MNIKYGGDYLLDDKYSKEIYKEEPILRGVKLKKIKCPLCKNNDFKLIGDINENQEFNHNEKQKLRKSCFALPIPLIKICCQECGYIFEYKVNTLVDAVIKEQKEYSGWPNGLQGNENDPLDERQKKFVKEYIKDSNTEMASIRAGYSPKTANANGTTLMCSRKIIKAIKKERERIFNENND